MGFFQVGFEVTRLPKDTTIATPMFQDMKNNNDNMASTNDSAAGIRLGIGSSVFQVAGSVSRSVCSDPFALHYILSGVYVGATSWVTTRLLRSPLAASPAAFHRPIVVLVGTLMASAFAATILPKPINAHHVRASAPHSESVDATNSKSL